MLTGSLPDLAPVYVTLGLLTLAVAFAVPLVVGWLWRRKHR